MICARKYESFGVHPGERWLFAGTNSGQISTIDVDSFRILSEVQAHSGSIYATVVHATLPYVAAMSVDRSVSVWKIGQDGLLSEMGTLSTRDIPAEEDTLKVRPAQSPSRALGFHDRERRLVTRTGSGALLELDFDETSELRVIRCNRFFGDKDMVFSRFLPDSNLVLSADNFGALVLSENGTIVKKWTVGDRNVHWAEQIDGDEYLLASDTLKVFRLDLSGKKEMIHGNCVLRDDLEHVDYNKTSKRAFISSFDRNIYEIDPQSCDVTRVAWRAPFKCDWIKSLSSSPTTLIVRVRNGSLHKVDVDTGRSLAMIKDTPNALWTSVTMPDGSLLFAGDGNRVLQAKLESVDHRSRLPRFSSRSFELLDRGFGHFKRMILHPQSGRLVLGRTDGTIQVGRAGGTFDVLCNLESAVRDISAHPEKPILFAACEDGTVYKLDLETGSPLLKFKVPSGEPIWSIAYNSERDLVAFSEREGSLYVLSGGDFSIEHEVPSRRTKRMKWADANTLFFVQAARFFKMDLAKGEYGMFGRSHGNTVEDFIWDRRRRYIVAITYKNTVVLVDYLTGQLISESPDQMDYAKGLTWVSEGAEAPGDLYPLDFLTFGRSGIPYLHRIHDEKILCLGPAAGIEFLG